MKSYLVKLALGLLTCFIVISAKAEEKVTVFAAASLANAVDEIVAEYKKEQVVNVITSYGASSTLARQIGQGAPADIFISADQRWLDYLADKNLVDKTSRVTLLANKLVVVAPVNSKLTSFVIDKETDWLALLNGGRLSVGDPDHVPAGVYAKQAFEYYHQWDKVLPVLARADNVRTALLLVERAETPLGIVYSTDALVGDKVKVISEFPAESHVPVEYPLVMVANHNRDSVDAFYRFLQSPKAKHIFAQHGFTTF